MMRAVAWTLACCPALAVAACTPVAGGTAPAPRQLTAQLYDAQGSPMGIATLSETAGGVRLAVNAQGLAPGTHGIHVHARGACAPPDFASAGGHFNPTGRRHGLNNPGGPHAGDFPNLEAGADGRAQYDVVTTGLALSGPGSLVADSAAIVIHAQRDYQVTDPSGTSGARIACGVLTVGGGRRRVP